MGYRWADYNGEAAFLRDERKLTPFSPRRIVASHIRSGRWISGEATCWDGPLASPEA